MKVGQHPDCCMGITGSFKTKFMVRIEGKPAKQRDLKNLPFVQTNCICKVEAKETVGPAKSGGSTNKRCYWDNRKASQVHPRSCSARTHWAVAR